MRTAQFHHAQLYTLGLLTFKPPFAKEGEEKPVHAAPSDQFVMITGKERRHLSNIEASRHHGRDSLANIGHYHGGISRFGD